MGAKDFKSVSRLEYNQVKDENGLLKSKLERAVALWKEHLDYDCQPDKNGTCRYSPPRICVRHQQYIDFNVNL